MISKIEEYQGDLFGRIKTLPKSRYAFVTLIRPRTSAEAVQVQTDIDNSLAGYRGDGGKSGVAITVNMPEFDVPNPNEPGPSGKLIGRITVVESPEINMGASGT